MGYRLRTDAGMWLALLLPLLLCDQSRFSAMATCRTPWAACAGSDPIPAECDSMSTICCGYVICASMLVGLCEWMIFLFFSKTSMIIGLRNRRPHPIESIFPFPWSTKTYSPYRYASSWRLDSFLAIDPTPRPPRPGWCSPISAWPFDSSPCQWSFCVHCSSSLTLPSQPKKRSFQGRLSVFVQSGQCKVEHYWTWSREVYRDDLDCCRRKWNMNRPTGREKNIQLIKKRIEIPAREEDSIVQLSISFFSLSDRNSVRYPVHWYKESRCCSDTVIVGTSWRHSQHWGYRSESIDCNGQ